MSLTPQSRKRTRPDDPDEHTIIKNVRFALDENNSRPPAIESGTSVLDVPSTTTRTSGIQFVHPANFEKVSPKKNTNEVVSTITWCSPTEQSAGRLDLRTPSPLILTPRRSAMKRRTLDTNAQRPLLDSGCTTPTGFRSSKPPRSTGRQKPVEQPETCLWPSLRFSNQPINQLCLKLAEPTRQRNLASRLKEIGVTKIGEFASLSPSKVEQIPHLRRPRIENALNFLRSIARSAGVESRFAASIEAHGDEVQMITVDSAKESTSPVDTRPVEEVDEANSDGSRNTPEDQPVEETNRPPNQVDTLDTMELVKESPDTPTRNQKAQTNDMNSIQTQKPTTSRLQNDSSEIDYVRFAHEVQERASGLTDLITTTLSAIAKPKLNPVKSLRDIRRHVRDAHVNAEECDELLELLMDLAKDVNQRRRMLSST